ncbi:MAG: hypothetical protein WDN31_03790 [Hyphomicrobium sp.]
MSSTTAVGSGKIAGAGDERFPRSPSRLQDRRSSRSWNAPVEPADADGARARKPEQAAVEQRPQLRGLVEEIALGRIELGELGDPRHQRIVKLHVEVAARGNEFFERRLGVGRSSLPVPLRVGREHSLGMPPVSESARRASSACRRLRRASTMAWSRSAMRRCSLALSGSWARIARSSSLNSPPMLPDLEHLLCRDLAVAHPAQGRPGSRRDFDFAFVEKPRRIGAPLPNDLRVLHIGFEHGVLRGNTLRLAIGLGLALRRIRLFQLVDVRFDDGDALCQLVELGRGEIAPCCRRGLPRWKTDQLSARAD